MPKAWLEVIFAQLRTKKLSNHDAVSRVDTFRGPAIDFAPRFANVVAKYLFEDVPKTLGFWHAWQTHNIFRSIPIIAQV
jgi:hypothetical protein